MPASLRICHTVDGASLYRSPVSSPWMRRYPQPGLSRAISSTSARTAWAVRGRPGLRRGYAHRLLTRSACQRSKVRGETIRRTWRRLPVGSRRASADKTARSAQDSLGA
jgi:hypothetical protein